MVIAFKAWVEATISGVIALIGVLDDQDSPF